MPVTFNNTPVTLVGQHLAVGDTLGSYVLVDENLASVPSKDLGGLRVYLTVPSLDTGVCDMEVRNFNTKAAALPGVQVYAVSMDLPFAQSRWCGANEIRHVTALSDYRGHSFGLATGTYMEQTGLLARAVFVVDSQNRVLYAEYVPEVSHHPQYETIYTRLQEITDSCGLDA